MNIQKIHLVGIIYIALITGCSNDLSIKSSTPDKVIIAAPAKSFLEAYKMANKECQEHTKSAKYLPDETASLKVVAFNCTADKVAPEAETEEASSQ